MLFQTIIPNPDDKKDGPSKDRRWQNYNAISPTPGFPLQRTDREMQVCFTSPFPTFDPNMMLSAVQKPAPQGDAMMNRK